MSRFFLWLDETWLALPRRGLPHEQELEYDLGKQETLVVIFVFGGVIGQWMFPTVPMVHLVHDWRVWAPQTAILLQRVVQASRRVLCLHVKLRSTVVRYCVTLLSHTSFQ